MKRRYKILVAAGVLLAFHAPLLAQTPANGTAHMSIVLPIHLIVDHSLNFGSFTAGTGGGTVILNASGLGPLSNQNPDDPIQGTNLTSTGAVGLLNTDQTKKNGGNPPEFASFEVTGEPGYGFTVSIPNGPVIIRNGNQPDYSMILTAFTTNLTGNAGALAGPLAPKPGTRYFAVGATLSVGSNQLPGDYISADGDGFAVTVQYN